MSGFLTARVLNFSLEATSAVATQADKGFDLITLGRNVINGLTFGSIYALVALGIVLIYKSSDVVNFGHGEMAMFSTFICFSVFGALLPPRKTNEQLPDSVDMGTFLLGLVATLIFAGVMGFLIERFLLQPLQKAPLLSQIMVTIGLGVMLYGIASLIWKADTKKFPVAEIVDGPGIIIGSGTSSLPIPREAIASLLVAGVLALALFLFFKFTMIGTAIRAMAQNPSTARLMGVNVNLLTGLTWVLAIMLAAIAGILAAPKVFLHPLMMANVVVNSFAAAVLGGITSLPGAVLGGLVIGIVDNLVGFYLPDGLRGMSAFVIIVLVLTIWPNGLFGKTVRKKV